MRLKFWGTRGSIATPGPSTIHYGGNTSCLELVTSSGQRVIFDCGTGGRLLGLDLMAHAPKPISALLLFGHMHWDHIQGFPFFAPAFVPGNHITVCGPEGCNSSLPQALAGQMQYTYFPVELGQLGAAITYIKLTEGSYEIEGVRISAQFLNHPTVALGYKIEADNVTMCYLCDHEQYSTTLWRAGAEPGKIDSILHANDRQHALFMKGADVVVHDAQYTPEEYPAKKNWGHSTYDYVAQIAEAAGVHKLYLTHHDPLHDDAFIENIERKSREIVKQMGSKMEVVCAYEGCEETLKARGKPRTWSVAAVAGAPAEAPWIEACGLNVLVVDDDEDLRMLAGRVLTQSGHVVTHAPGGAEALKMIEQNPPDLIVLDLNMPQPDGIEVLRTLRSVPKTASLPVIILTAEGDETTTRLSFELGATDFLNKPFSPPQLDARVRASFARALGGSTQH